jgi:drug/metabolite transporter (DMT)-like permease
MMARMEATPEVSVADRSAGMAEPLVRRRLGVLAVSVATVVWASGTVLAKWSSLSGPSFAMFRLWAGVVVSLASLAVLRRRLTWAMFRATALGGVIFAADIALHFTSVKLTSVADVALIGALAPVAITVVSAKMLHERVARRDALLVVCSFLGVAIVAIGSSGSPTFSLAGDLLAMFGIVTWSAYWFFSRRARQDVPAIEYFASVMIAGAIVITPFTLLVEGVPSWPAPSDWAAVWAVAILPGFVGHTLVIWSHRHVESWRSALITQCTPVISALLAWAVLDEPIPLLVAVGGAVVITSTGAVIVAAARRGSSLALDEAAEPAS